MTRFQGDLRDMDEIIQGISNVQTEHRVGTEKSKGFYPKNTVWQSTYWTNVLVLNILKKR